MSGRDCCAPRPARRSADLVVIGAGSAGFAAAIRGAELGARVTLVGHGTIGGTCVNIGCVPSKTLIRAAEAVHGARAAARFAGIFGAAALADWSALVAQKNALVAALRHAKYEELLGRYDGISYVEGRARLAEQAVEIDGALTTTARTIIASGAAPALPAIRGIAEIDCLTSTSALGLERLPSSLLVIGGGFVGCELGQMFARLGVRVTILCRTRLLPQAEPEISAALTGYLRGEEIEIRCGLAYQSIARTAEGVALVVRGADGRTEILEAERVLAATGRRPNTEGLGLAELGVALEAGGGIRVDDRLRTTRPGVYAAGDVTGRDMFVYMAAYGAKLAAENALSGDARRYDNSAMPAVVFTDPQLASVGLTEAMARRGGRDVATSMVALDQLPRALAARDTRGLVKLVAERRSGRLIGAHLLAPEACDSIQTAALAIKHGMTASDLAETVFPHLTNVEALKLAAIGFAKDVATLSCCAA